MITERLSRRRQIAEAVAVLAIVATSVGVAAFKYNETEAQIRRATVEATINPYLITEGVKTINFDPSEIAREQETLTRHSFDPLPEGQIQDHKELVKETKDRINTTLAFMAESQNPVFKSAAHFLRLYGEANTVVITPVDSLPQGKSPMYAAAAVSEDGLGYAIVVSRDDALYKLGTLGMALEITGQVEGIRHNMEHVLTTKDDVGSLSEKEIEYLGNKEDMAQRLQRENGAITEALLTQIELGYDGIVNAEIQTKSQRFLELNGNPFGK